MIKKMRILFILASMTFLLLMQGLIIYFSYMRSYSHLAESSDNILQQLFADPETVLSSEYHYFTIVVDSKNYVSSVSIHNSQKLNRETAVNYAQTAINSGKERGFVEGYRYIITHLEDGSVKLAFLLRAGNIAMIKNNMQSLIIFSTCGLLIILLVLIPVSKLLVWPLEESDRRQKAFITQASHALKTPITIISTSADLLLDENPTDECLNAIKKESSNLANMTNDLIMITKMDIRQDKSSFIEFPISDVINQITDSFSPLITSNNQTLTKSIVDGISYYGDENSIRQLVNLLMDNACKYAGKNGSISLELKKMQGKPVLTISNTSLHYDKYELAHLFDRFYRSSSTKEKGFGIGLYAAKSIVDFHGGKITVAQPADNLICFTVKL